MTLEYRVVHNNVDCGGDNFVTSTSGVVLKLFRPAKSKIHQDWTIVCRCNEAGDWAQ